MTDLEMLATLDPARNRVPTEVECRRARASVNTILRDSRRPARAPVRRRVAIASVSLAAAGVVAGGIVGVPGLTKTDTAEAAWLPVPTAANPSQALEQAQACTRSWDATPTTHAVAAEDVLLAEGRGISTLTVMRKGNVVIECLSTDPGTLVGWSQVGEARTPLPADGVATIADMGATGDGGNVHSSVVGHAGPGVSEIEIVRANGDHVQASINNGWWAAWWPGAEGGDPSGVNVIVHTTQGGVTEHASSELYN
jgi:hypothetical protein